MPINGTDDDTHLIVLLANPAFVCVEPRIIINGIRVASQARENKFFFLSAHRVRICTNLGYIIRRQTHQLLHELNNARILVLAFEDSLSLLLFLLVLRNHL